jgi:hypothetical protein
MTEHTPIKTKDYDPNDPRNQAAAQTPIVDAENAGPGEPGYYNPPDPNFGVSHTGSNEIRPEALVKKAEEIPDTRSPWDKKQQGETGTGTHKPAHNDMTDEEYEAHTVPELREMADERGIEIKSDARKDEIIEALKKG